MRGHPSDPRGAEQVHQHGGFLLRDGDDDLVNRVNAPSMRHTIDPSIVQHEARCGGAECGFGVSHGLSLVQTSDLRPVLAKALPMSAGRETKGGARG